MRHRRPRTRLLVLAMATLGLGLTPAGGAQSALDVGSGEVVAAIGFDGATEIDFDGRYAYVGQFNGRYDRATVSPTQEGGLRIIDMVGDDETPQFTQVGYLHCPGTDNYIRWMDPAVYNPDEPERQFIAMAHHGNICTRNALSTDPNTAGAFGGFNGVAVVEVTDRTDPRIVAVVGHDSAHTVMPHPTRPYLFILPGGLANGTSAAVGNGRVRSAPTAIVDVSDPTDPVYVQAFSHNLTGCHDMGFTHDGAYAYCAGLGETQVWDIRGDRITSPLVVGTIVNPAIQFAHNAVVSPDGRYLLINDEAFGFHTCEGEAADLYGSLWIYDIAIPDVPVLAGRIAPPATAVGPNLAGWVGDWCAAHNYSFVPGTSIVVASWFAGGMTAHDISDPLQPQLLAQYQPGGDSVMWSAHYYGGYVITGDMGLGVEILDIPALREAEQAGDPVARGEGLTAPLADLLPVAGPFQRDLRQDLTGVLVPAVLPPRPEVRARGLSNGGVCILPA
jgi:hypothetical protein